MSRLGSEMPEFIIAGGDSNTVFSHLDKEGGSKKLMHKAIHAFEDFKNRFELIDTFRVKHPQLRNYSWESLNTLIIKERIDVIFASNSLIDYVSESGIIPPCFTCSDHGISFLKIKGYGVPTRGPGLWKFNNSLLNEPSFISDIKEFIPCWIEQAEKDLPDNAGIQWAFLKHKIGEYSRNFGAKLKKAKKILRENLEKELSILTSQLDVDSKNRYQALKLQLNEIIEHEIKGSVLRSLCKDCEEGEKCTKYFFNLERYNAIQKTITCLRGSKGGLVTDQKDILEECRQFYMNLYSKK